MQDDRCVEDEDGPIDCFKCKTPHWDLHRTLL